MDKTIAKSNSKAKARVLAASNGNGVSGIRIDIKVVNVPELLMLKAEEALRALIPELPDEDISYPIDPDLIPEGKSTEVSDLLIDYINMTEYSNRVEKGGPGCGNGQCMIGSVLVCCEPPPPTLMATLNDSTFIERHAYAVPNFFKLTFLDNAGNEMDFIIKSIQANPHLSYYRVLDEELIVHINVEVKDAFVLNP